MWEGFVKQVGFKLGMKSEGVTDDEPTENDEQT